MFNYETIIQLMAISIFLISATVFYIMLFVLICKTCKLHSRKKTSRFVTQNRCEAPLSKGKRGEYEVAKKLESLGGEYYVINDVMLDTSTKTSQIDHIVISPYGIFVIETKNFSGTLCGSAYDNYISHLCNGKKYMIYNPLKQNLSHVRTLMQVLETDNKELFIPILTVADDCICDIEAKTDIVPFSAIRNSILQHSRELLTVQEVREIAQRIFNMNIVNEEERLHHIERVRLMNECPF